MEDDILTIMFVKQSGGKIRSVKLEIKKLFYLAVGIISLILAFIALIYGYYSIYNENSHLTAMVISLERPEKKVAVSEAIENVTLKESIESKVEEQKKVSEIKEESKEVKESQEKLVENLNGKITEILSTDSDSEKVTITDFRVEMNKNKPGIKVFFSINNVKQVSRITGYWTLVGENKKNKNKVVYRSYPKRRVNKNGEILKYKNATSSSITWFSIERFKIISAVLEFDNEFDDYDTIYIYVFSNKSELLLTSQFNRWILTS